MELHFSLVNHKITEKNHSIRFKFMFFCRFFGTHKNVSVTHKWVPTQCLGNSAIGGSHSSHSSHSDLRVKTVRINETLLYMLRACVRVCVHSVESFQQQCECSSRTTGSYWTSYIWHRDTEPSDSWPHQNPAHSGSVNVVFTVCMCVSVSEVTL